MQTTPTIPDSLKQIAWVHSYQTNEGLLGFLIGRNVNGDAVCARIVDTSLLEQYFFQGVRLDEMQPMPLSERKIEDPKAVATKKSILQQFLTQIFSQKRNKETKQIEIVETSAPRLVMVPRWIKLDSADAPLTCNPEVIKAILYQLENNERRFKQIIVSVPKEDLIKGIKDVPEHIVKALAG